MMQRILRGIALILAVCLAGTALCGCDAFRALFSPAEETVFDASAYAHTEGMTFRRSPYYSPAAPRYGYDALEERQQQLYDRILEQVYTISQEPYGSVGKYPLPPVTVPGKLDTAAMLLTIRALKNDHPYLFWLSLTFSHLFYPDENYTRVVAFSEFSPATVATMLEQLDDRLDDFFAAVPDALSPYAREKYVHDYVIETCSYDSEIARMTEETEANLIGHSIYGALVRNSCVCEGYGAAMQFLLNELGVPCVGLTGKAYDGTQEDENDDALHLWNAVELDGEWYHVDATWDDRELSIQRYSYFNLDDARLMEDHVLSRTPDQFSEAELSENGTEDLNFFIPVCEGTKYYYFSYACPHLEDYDGAAVQEALYRAAQEQNEYLTFYIDPELLDYSEAVDLLFHTAPQYFFGYVRTVNDRLADYEIDSSNLSYYADESRSSVTVELRYI